MYHAKRTGYPSPKTYEHPDAARLWSERGVPWPLHFQISGGLRRWVGPNRGLGSSLWVPTTETQHLEPESKISEIDETSEDIICHHKMREGDPIFSHSIFPPSLSHSMSGRVLAPLSGGSGLSWSQAAL
jgi:hypothetical protein